jgi:hypothetical protein
VLLEADGKGKFMIALSEATVCRQYQIIISPSPEYRPRYVLPTILTTVHYTHYGGAYMVLALAFQKPRTAVYRPWVVEC